MILTRKRNDAYLLILRVNKDIVLGSREAHRLSRSLPRVVAQGSEVIGLAAVGGEVPAKALAQEGRARTP